MVTLLVARVGAMADAGPGSTSPPPHPVYAMTGRELERYRLQLERALRPGSMPAFSPARAMLAQQLGEVIAEQQAREQAAAPANGGD